MNFFGKHIALGVTGGIAAYKACEIVSLLKKAGADVTVVMTKNAREFVAPLTFETLSGNRVVGETFERNFSYDVGHISLAKKADAFVIAPATANLIGKFANGIADDFLSTTIMAFTKPVLIAPAMNTNMLNSPANMKNIAALKERGVNFIHSAVGRLACGDEGAGRLAAPRDIVSALYHILFPKKDFDGKTVLVTAGATREPIDPVRFIGNRSSGKMGVALAGCAAARGARVILIHGQMSVPLLETFYKTIAVETTEQLYQAVMEQVADADIIIKAAAPSDYKISASVNKIKSTTVTLELSKNVDIAAEVGKVKGGKKLVIFAAETENLIANAKEKLKKKNADLVIANDVTCEGAGFSADTNIITVISKSTVTPFEKMTKQDAADVILDFISEL